MSNYCKDIKVLLNSLPEVPPVSVVAVWGCASTEYTPSPLVDEVAEGKKGYLLQSHL